jgi:hypothetical protein
MANKLERFQPSPIFIAPRQRKGFYNFDTWDECYKTFYASNLRIIVIS